MQARAIRHTAMDDIVLQALAKWPNVPHCRGWLALDRRGQWRMRNEYAQAHGLPGEPIRHEALLGFIARNYAADEHGQWFFQNGPQRVYVELEYTPWVLRLMPDARAGWRLQTSTGAGFDAQRCLHDEDGAILIAGSVDDARAPTVGVLHDHDLEIFAGQAVLDHSACGALGTWRHDGRAFDIEPILRSEVPAQFGFVASPAAHQR